MAAPTAVKNTKPSSSSLLLLFLTLALVLLLFSLSSSPSSYPHRPHRRLKLRSGAANSSPLSGGGSGDSHHQIPFDPIIADLERRRDDREWERAHFAVGGEHAPAMEAQPEWESSDDEDYINDEARFNVTQRVEALFPKIDADPADGFITAAEMAEWNLALSRRETVHRTARELELHDKNKDGFVSFAEYERPSWAWRFDDNNSTNDGMGWWKEDHFNASDIDGDGLLNLTEFNDFLHPADSSNQKLIHWLCKEEVRERDKDNDGKLNFEEFFNGLFHSIRNYDEDDISSHNFDGSEAPAKKLLSRLDQDNDGLLSADELKSVIGNLHPSEHFYAKQQADYVISQADTDKDGRLSMKEMIDNPYVFYSAIFTEDDYGFHDEFR